MRFIAVQFKIDRDDFNGGFPIHVRKFYENTRPGDFIIFPEDIGLLTAFSGLNAQSTTEAMQVLYSKNQNKIDFINGEGNIQNFVSSIFLALTDTFVRDFYNLFSSLSREYSVYTLACNNMSRFSKRGGEWDFLETKVFNTAFVFDSSGELRFSQDKVFLTPMEFDLGISGGDISSVSTFDVGGKRVGIAISLDAFVPRYISRLEEADMIIQPDANPVKWNSTLSNGRWQPEEWMDSAYYIAQRMDRVRNVINPMMVGDLLDIRFEGQSSITKKAEEGDERMGYVGNIPSSGFHSVFGIQGYDTHEYVNRESVSGKSLAYEEGILEIEL